MQSQPTDVILLRIFRWGIWDGFFKFPCPEDSEAFSTSKTWEKGSKLKVPLQISHWANVHIVIFGRSQECWWEEFQLDCLLCWTGNRECHWLYMLLSDHCPYLFVLFVCFDVAKIRYLRLEDRQRKNELR